MSEELDNEEEVLDDNEVNEDIYDNQEDINDDGYEDNNNDNSGDDQSDYQEDEGESEDYEDQDNEASGQSSGSEGLTADQVKEIAAGVAEGLRPQEEAKPVQFTEEQIQTNFKPYKVSAKDLEGMGFDDPTPEQIAGFQMMANAIVTQAITTSNTLADNRIQQVRDEYQPHLQQIQADKQAAHEKQEVDNFYGKYEGLAKYQKIVSTAANNINHLRADGTAKSVAQVEKEVVDGTLAILAEVGVTGVNPTKAGATRSAGGSKGGGSRMASTRGTSGRSSGSNNESHSESQKNPDAAIY